MIRSNVVALRLSDRPRPFDWERDEFSTIEVTFDLTPFEVNLALAWLEHDAAPRQVRETAAKMRAQLEQAQP